MKNLLLPVALILNIVSVLPYIRDILHRKTKPSIVTWSTWALLTGVATAAEFAAGEYTTAIFTLVSTIGALSVALLGLRYGHAGYTIIDFICQIGALVGLALWITLNNPLLAVLTMIFIDFIGAIPTFRHVWRHPEEETASAYAIGTASAIFSILSLTSHSVVALAFPVYLAFADAALAGLIRFRSRT